MRTKFTQTAAKRKGLSVSRYLVTGGCGFIGSHLVEALLDDGHEVRVLDNLTTGRRENLPPKAELIVGDIEHAKTVARAVEGVDGVFHLAAVSSVKKSMEQWLLTHGTNVTGTIVLLDAIRHLPKAIPMVYASSAAIYGDQASETTHEDLIPNPVSTYAVDKLSCEYYAKVASKLFSIPSLGCRFFNVYGPRQNPDSPYSGVISIFTCRMIQNKPVTIFGDGQQSRDFVYVADVVEGLMRSMTGLRRAKTATASVVNICTSKAITIKNLAEELKYITHSESIIKYAEARAGDIRMSVGDNQRLREMLSFKPRVTLREGLKYTVASMEIALRAQVFPYQPPHLVAEGVRLHSVIS